MKHQTEGRDNYPVCIYWDGAEFLCYCLAVCCVYNTFYVSLSTHCLVSIELMLHNNLNLYRNETVVELFTYSGTCSCCEGIKLDFQLTTKM